jgi:hypothetical protein
MLRAYSDPWGREYSGTASIAGQHQQDKVDEQIRRGLEESDKFAARFSDAEFRRKLLHLKQPL